MTFAFPPPPGPDLTEASLSKSKPLLLGTLDAPLTCLVINNIWPYVLESNNLTSGFSVLKGEELNFFSQYVEELVYILAAVPSYDNFD